MQLATNTSQGKTQGLRIERSVIAFSRLCVCTQERTRRLSRLSRAPSPHGDCIWVGQRAREQRHDMEVVACAGKKNGSR